MSEYPNSGILNVNKYKRAGSKQPDFNGRVLVTCIHCQQQTEFMIAAWDRGRFTTLALTEKAEAERKKAEAKAKHDRKVNGEAEPAEEAEQPKTGQVPF